MAKTVFSWNCPAFKLQTGHKIPSSLPDKFLTLPKLNRGKIAQKGKGEGGNSVTS